MPSCTFVSEIFAPRSVLGSGILLRTLPAPDIQVQAVELYGQLPRLAGAAADASATQALAAPGTRTFRQYPPSVFS